MTDNLTEARTMLNNRVLNWNTAEPLGWRWIEAVFASVESGEAWLIEKEHKPVAVIVRWDEYLSLLDGVKAE